MDLSGSVRSSVPRQSQQESQVNERKELFRVGSIGAAIAAICCFTPALVVLVGFAGLSEIVVTTAAQLAASWTNSAVMHREPSVTMARQIAVKQLDKEIVRQMEFWSQMSEPGNA